MGMGVLLLSACASQAPMTRMAVDDGLALSGDLASTVDALVLPLLAARETPGVVVGVLDDAGRQHFFSYGQGEQNGAPLSADSLFPIGSLSKGYLGGLLSVLVSEGRLRWDERLDSLLPGTPLSRDAARISLEQLATHSAGLPRQPTDLGLLLGLSRFTFNGENFYNRFDETFLKHYLLDFEAPASIRPAYSNIGFALIGMAIEQRTGESLESLLETRLLRPLGLRNTGYRPAALPGAAHRAQGHAGDQPKFMRRGTPVDDWQFTPAMRGSAGIYTSARDLLAFAQAHLHGQDGLAALLADNLRVRTPQPLDAPGIAWVTDRHGDLEITNQVGMAVGHTSYVGIDRARRSAVVVLQTSFNWNFKVGHVLLQRLAVAPVKQVESSASPPEAAVAADAAVARR